MLHQAEKRHLEQTGKSLLASVDVLALNEHIYPAQMDIPAIANPGEELGLVETLKRVAAVLIETPLHMLVRNAVTGFLEGLERGRVSTPDYLTAYEQQIGCAPSYILMGCSQGALVLSHKEAALEKKGQLKGVFYMGNPLMGSDSVNRYTTTRVGHRGDEVGLLGWLPVSWQPQSAKTNHVELCSEGDFACDTTMKSLTTSFSSRADQHAENFIDMHAYDHALEADLDADAPVDLIYRTHTADESRAIDEIIRMIAA